MKMQVIKARLNEKLARLEERLLIIKKDLSKIRSADFSERDVERENHEVIEAIGGETESAIQDIRSALERIDEGTYGSCSSCGEEISIRRLEVLPETAVCLSCAVG